MNQQIRDITSFDQQRDEMRRNIVLSNKQLLHSLMRLKSFKQKQINTQFIKPSWETDLEAMADMRQQFWPRMTAKILSATIFRKKGFFKRMWLSAITKLAVKKILKKEIKHVPLRTT